MQYLTDILESKTIDIKSELASTKAYVDSLDKKLPDDVKKVTYLLQKCNIFSSDEVQKIRNASGSAIRSIARDYDVREKDIEDIHRLLVDIDKAGMMRAVPMMLTDRERDNVIRGNIGLEDVTLDLTTDHGRNEVTKQYIPLVKAISTKYLNKSSLGRDELISAGMIGLVDAMNNYRKPSKSDNLIPFKKYAGYMIQHSILNDMDDLSRTVKVPKEYRAKQKAQGLSGEIPTISIDKAFNADDEDGSMIDRMIALSETPEYGTHRESDEKLWKKVSEFVTKTFPQKQASMFFKLIGINGFKRMKQTEIATEMGCTKANVSIAIKKIVSALRDNPQMYEAIRSLMGIYTETLLIDNYRNGKDAIMEAFLTDDIYLLLEDITRWSDPTVLENTVKNIIMQYNDEDARFLSKALNADFIWVDDNYRKNKKLIVNFLENMNPTEYMKRKSDVEILNMFMDIADNFKKFKIKL